MSKKPLSTYEIIFKGGATLTLENVSDISVESHDRKITKFNVTSTDEKGDVLKFLDISEVVAISKKGKKGLWKR